MAYPMRVELTAGGNVEIQPPGLSGHSWVMSKENALKLAQWIVELVQGELAGNPLDHSASFGDEFPCPICGGTVGHLPNCPRGIAFT